MVKQPTHETAMEAKNFDLQVLQNTSSPQLQIAAARAYGEKKWPSGIALILPTVGVPDTNRLAKEGQQDLARDKITMTEVIQNAEGSPEARAMALYWRNTIALLQEVGLELGNMTAEIQLDHEGNPIGNHPDLDDGDEPGTDPDIRLSAAVRGPFQFFPPVRECKEQAFSMAVDCGGCGVVVKEFRGLQLRLVLRRLTKVVEPWFSRARIVFRWVWVLEWVPVEVIKTISIRCGCDRGATQVTKKVILDRELVNFWRCF